MHKKDISISQENKLLKEELAMYRLIMDTADVILVVLDPKGTIQLINEKGCNLLGFSKDELIGENWFNTCIPDDTIKKQTIKTFNDIISGKVEHVKNYENWIQTKSGKKRYIKWSNTLIRDENGNIKNSLSSGEDITTQRRLIRELHKNEEKYRYLVDHSLAGIFQTTRDGEFIYVNPELPRIIEYDNQQQMLNQSVHIHYANIEKRDILLKALKEQGFIKNFELEIVTKRNKRKNIILNAALQGDVITGMMLDLSDYKRTRDKLDERESQVKELFGRSPDPIYLIDSTGRIADANPAACKELGYSHNELLTFKVNKIDPDFKTRDNEIWFWQRMPLNESITFEATHIRKNGESFPVEVKASCFKSFGKVYLYALVRNLTQRKQEEKLIRDNEAKYRTLLDNLPQKIFYKDLDLNFVAVNPPFSADLGKTPEELVGKNDLDFFNEEKAAKFQADDREVLKNGQPIEYEEEYIHDGKKMTNQVFKTPIYNDNKDLLGLLGIFWDTSDRKKAEVDLIRSEEKFKRIFKSIQEGYFLLDLEGIIQNVNPSTLRILEYENSCELINFPIAETIFKNSYEFRRLKRLLIKESKVSNYRVEFKRKNGEFLIAGCSINLLVEDGKPYAIEGTFRDETERIWAEEGLKSSLGLNRIMQDFNVDEMIEHGLEEAVRLTASHIGFFHFVNEKAGTISLQTWSKETRRHCNVPDKIEHYPIKDAGIWADCIRNKKPVVHNNYVQEKNKKGLPEGHFRLIRELVVPIIENGLVVAVIGVGNKISEYSKFDIKQLSFYGENVWSIIRRKQTENDLKIAKDEAIEANKAKSTFLANMSHEIRTPMNSVIGFADLLETHITDPVQNNYLESIKSSGRTLLSLINDILDLSKIEAGRLIIQPEPTNIRSLFKEIGHIFTIQAENKGIELIFNIKREIPSLFKLDEIRLRQILLNLVGNAIKFTEKGYVKVNCSYLKSGTLKITVRDTGIGIAKEAHESIFDSFRQQDEQDMRKYGGTGLGLAITKRLVELMSGTISLKSEPNRGSTFKIELKNIVPAPPEKRIKTKTPKYHYHFKPATVLIVDDIKSNRDLIKGYLNNTGLAAIEAENGQEAIQIAKQKQPDLVLMDIRMPVMDGYEATQFMKEEKELQSIPILALTASIGIEKRVIEKEGLFQGILFKPLTSLELLTELSFHLQNKKLAERTNTRIFQVNPAEIKNLKKLSLLIERLDKEILTQWKNVSEASSINDFEIFSETLEKLADEYSIKPLKEYAAQLSSYSKGFDIENIQIELKRFPKIVKELKTILKSPKSKPVK